MKKILLLNPLKDIPFWGLTTHALNVFPRLPADAFVSYGFFSNPVFASPTLRQLPEYSAFHGLWAAIREMRSVEPDILYGTGSVVEIFFLLFRPRAAKYIIAWHGPYDKRWILDIENYSFRARLGYFLASFLLRHADSFTCDSEFIAASLRKAFPGKAVVVTLNGVDTDFYNPAKRDPQWLAKKFSIALGRPVFVFVGHLIRRKRPEIFVELARRIPEAFFLMIGREGLYTAQDVAVWEKGVENLTWNSSSISREEMPRLLASVSGLVFPSLEEPFGLAVVETMASGSVVIATRSGALPELIEDGKEGFLIDTEPSELDKYEIILRKVMRGGSAMGDMRAKARAKTGALFMWDGVAKRYAEAFRSVLE